MTKILDQYGYPIDTKALDEPQTAEITALQNRYLTPMLGGLTPQRLARTLQAADMGDLQEQHRLFSDMEERDGHMTAEMGKRKNAIVGLSWDIVPPRNANAAEKAAAEWVRETLQDGCDGIEDLLLAMMDGVGHGFAAIELEWHMEEKQWLPQFHPRPQEWFKLNQVRTRINLDDGSIDGAQLRPFGWIMHQPAMPKTGYAARLGLFRTLVWPFLYKAYSLGDFAEFLETYGIPIIIGKYAASSSADEKASLMRAVNALGHDARAIMPKEMELEIESVTGGSGASSHMTMMEWADKAESKVILGQTLTADTGSKGGGSFALGKVHNEVRRDIMKGDARQIAATLTRDLIYPLVTLNIPGITSLRRCPRLQFQVEDAADMAAMAENLPKLVGVGFQIPLSWAQEKMHIPTPKEGEPVLVVKQAPVTNLPAPTAGTEALSTALPAAPAPAAPAADLDPVAGDVLQLSRAAAPTWDSLVDQVKALVDGTTDLAVLQAQLVDAFGGQPSDDLVKLMAAAFALAELRGMSDVQDGR